MTYAVAAGLETRAANRGRVYVTAVVSGSIAVTYRRLRWPPGFEPCSNCVGHVALRAHLLEQPVAQHVHCGAERGVIRIRQRRRSEITGDVVGRQLSLLQARPRA